MLNRFLDLCANMFADSPSADLQPTAGTTSHLASNMEVSWTNGFGTLNDFEVPASSCSFDDPFSS